MVVVIRSMTALLNSDPTTLRSVYRARTTPMAAMRVGTAGKVAMTF